jgi:hypothetical protein
MKFFFGALTSLAAIPSSAAAHRRIVFPAAAAAAAASRFYSTQRRCFPSTPPADPEHAPRRGSRWSIHAGRPHSVLLPVEQRRASPATEPSWPRAARDPSSPWPVGASSAEEEPRRGQREEGSRQKLAAGAEEPSEAPCGAILVYGRRRWRAGVRLREVLLQASMGSCCRWPPGPRPRATTVGNVRDLLLPATIPCTRWEASPESFSRELPLLHA